VDVKLKIELSNGGRVVSLDEFTKTFLEAIQRAVRQESQPLQIPPALPEEPASASALATRRALAVSKAEAVSAAARSTTVLRSSKSPCFASAAELVGSRTGAMLLRCGLAVAPRFLWECLNSRAVSRFPAPASSNPSCRFPAMGLPARFLPRVM
jgi:hypothetical protein